ncbi:hypothetical protein [Rhodopseudomonas pseudopalustris]|uniref:Uncharacterized protein n=1 Tax=Rhodopseudomonas pseudopalustris TaxID=1513892 RepID=A0A1H8WIT6_9BRAD|nr:hypothetical protein [Rhodopseudomonas pseudopalustris]SEP27337.1 hypothetical protein SAMN05444123_112115 [Rhodopseudomonas pseudopalustris]
MDWKTARKLVEQVPSVSVIPFDSSAPRMFCIRAKDGTVPYSIMLPEGDDDLAEAQFLMMLHHGRIWLIQNPPPKMPVVA